MFRRHLFHHAEKIHSYIEWQTNDRLKDRCARETERQRGSERDTHRETGSVRDRICESGLSRTSEGILIVTLLEFCDLKQVCLMDPFAFLSHQNNHVGYSSFLYVLSGFPKLL